MNNIQWFRLKRRFFKQKDGIYQKKNSNFAPLNFKQFSLFDVCTWNRGNQKLRQMCVR
jgi:hypothetical protein